LSGALAILLVSLGAPSFWHIPCAVLWTAFSFVWLIRPSVAAGLSVFPVLAVALTVVAGLPNVRQADLACRVLVLSVVAAVIVLAVRFRRRETRRVVPAAISLSLALAAFLVDRGLTNKLAVRACSMNWSANGQVPWEPVESDERGRAPVVLDRKVAGGYCYDVIFSPELKDRLIKLNRPAVPVEYNVVSDFGRVRGYNIRSVDGLIFNEGGLCAPTRVTADKSRTAPGLRIAGDRSFLRSRFAGGRGMPSFAPPAEASSPATNQAALVSNEDEKPGGMSASDITQVLALGRSEAELVGELQAGSAEAFDALVTHYHAVIYNLALRILGDAGDAADATQEVFLKAFRGLRGFRGSSSIRTWLYRIALREASNFRRWRWRHQRNQTSVELVDPAELRAEEPNGASPFDRLAAREVQGMVREALRSVPEPFRAALVLRDIEGLSYEELAEVLEVPVGTVKSRILRGRRALREILGPALEGLEPRGRAAAPSPAEAPAAPRLVGAGLRPKVSAGGGAR
jgi:RNA polymerase sigma-70 factor (ECF subfamily)